MTFRSHTISAYDDIGSTCKCDELFNVFCPDPVAGEAFEDKIRHRFIDRGRHPNNIGASPKGRKACKIRGSLVGPTSYYEYGAPYTFVACVFPRREKCQAPGPVQISASMGAPNINDVRTSHLGPVECTDPVCPHTRGGNISSNDLCSGCICHRRACCQGFFESPCCTGPEKGIDDDICLFEKEGKGTQVICGYKRMDIDLAAGQCSQLVGASRGTFAIIQIEDIRIHTVLEVPGSHHSVSPVVSASTENRYRGRLEIEY